jgi:Leucine-rich repeat (LRR) protein
MAGTLVDDQALTLLTQFPKLRKLRISNTKITGKGLAHLAGLSNLQWLDLSDNRAVSDDAMAPLGKLTSLNSLNLYRVPITDAGVEQLAGLVNMESLNLDTTGLTDAGLPHLANMNKLTFLHLGVTKVSDAGLKHLESLQSLKDLIVTRTDVTAAGVAKLQQALPETRIQLEYVAGQ